MKKLLCFLALSVAFMYANQDWQKACDGGDDEACLALGRAYYKGSDGVEQNHAKALELYTLVCETHNNMNGCFKKGMFYSEGRGVEHDHAKSMEYLKKACDGGLDKACTMMERVSKED